MFLKQTAFNSFNVTCFQNFTINYWIEKGLDRKKTILGMPMYGQSFTMAWGQEPVWNQKTQGGAQAGPFTRARGFLAYYEVKRLFGSFEYLFNDCKSVISESKMVQFK